MSRRHSPIILLLLFFALLPQTLRAQTGNPFLSPQPSSEQTQPKEHEGEKQTLSSPVSSQGWFIAKIVTLQKQFNEKVAGLIATLKEEKSSLAFFTILLLSFLYGVIHALGPGHGKAILAGWTLASPKTLRSVLLTGSLAALLHAFSAVFIVLGSWILLRQTSSLSAQKVSDYLQLAAGILLLLIGAFALLHYICSFFRQPDNNSPKKKDYSALKPFHVVLSVGIVPCPISSVLLIFSVSYGLFWQGIVFVLALAAGMAFTLIAVGLAVWLGRKKMADIRHKKMDFVFRHILPPLSALFFALAGIFIVMPFLV